MITVTADLNLFVWLLLVLYAVNSFSRVVQGIRGSKKDDHYTVWDAADGAIGVAIVILVFVL